MSKLQHIFLTYHIEINYFFNLINENYYEYDAREMSITSKVFNILVSTASQEFSLGVRCKIKRGSSYKNDPQMLVNIIKKKKKND